MTQGRMIFKDAQMEKPAVPFRQGGRDAYSMVMTLRELDDCLPDREGGQDLDKFTAVNRPLLMRHTQDILDFMKLNEDWILGNFTISAKPDDVNRNRRNSMSYLVVGNALTETIIRSQDGAQRQHTGGVGAIMARELALTGARVTLLTTAPQGGAARQIQADLEKHGVTPIVVPGQPAQTRAGWAEIITRRGEPVRASGSWPRMGGLQKQITELAPEHDWTLISLNIMPQDLQAARKLAPNLAVNATSKGLAVRMARTGEHRLATMNGDEARKLIAHLGTESHARLPKALRAKTVMVTLGRRGRALHHADGSAETHPAVPVPAGADFIGAGDAATAGLVLALSQGLDPGETVDQAISGLLKRNAQAYRNGR